MTSWIFWASATVTLGSAAFAALAGDIRKAALALWLAGLGSGGLFLSLGAELLAILQWVVSTLVAVSFIFYAVLFGEYGQGGKGAETAADAPAFKTYSSAVLLGAGFCAVIGLAGSEISVPHDALGSKAGDLAVIGAAVSEDYLLALEIFALTLFLVIVGAGVVARPDVGEK